MDNNEPLSKSRFLFCALAGVIIILGIAFLSEGLPGINKAKGLQAPETISYSDIKIEPIWYEIRYGLTQGTIFPLFPYITDQHLPLSDGNKCPCR